MNIHQIKISSNNNSNSLHKYLNDICVLDTTFRKKQTTISNLLDKYNSTNKDFIQKKNDNSEILIILNDLHNQLKNNTKDLYDHRMNVVKFIKNNKQLTKEDKMHISNYLIKMFNTQVNVDNISNNDKNMICCLQPNYLVNDINTSLSNNIKLKNNGEQGVDISTLDKAYLQKHNELTQMFKAYQVLFKKVGDYKKKLDDFKKLNISPIISKNKMNQMLNDQKYIMNSVDKMQQYLVDENILKPEERIPTNPVVNHPNNLKSFNSEMKNQINSIITQNSKINNNDKNELIKIIKSRIPNKKHVILLKK